MSPPRQAVPTRCRPESRGSREPLGRAGPGTLGGKETWSCPLGAATWGVPMPTGQLAGRGRPRSGRGLGACAGLCLIHTGAGLPAKKLFSRSSSPRSCRTSRCCRSSGKECEASPGNAEVRPRAEPAAWTVLLCRALAGPAGVEQCPWPLLPRPRHPAPRPRSHGVQTPGVPAGRAAGWGLGTRRPAPLAACCLWDAVLRLACLRAEGWRQPCCCRTRLRGDCRPLPGEVVLGASLSALSQPPRAFTRPGDSGSAGSAWLLNRQQVASARRSASSAARCELTSDQGSQNGTCPVGGQASCCPHRAPLVLTIQQKVEALPRTTRGQWQTPSGRRLVCHTPPGPSVTRSHTWRSWGQGSPRGGVGGQDAPRSCPWGGVSRPGPGKGWEQVRLVPGPAEQGSPTDRCRRNSWCPQWARELGPGLEGRGLWVSGQERLGGPGRR